MSNKVVALIPARTGSKRFPNKNKILWQYTRDFIIKSKLFSRAVVSSDGGQELFPFSNGDFTFKKRNPELALDETPIKPVIEDIVKDCSEEVFCLLYLTSPSRRVSILEDAIEKFYTSNAQSMMSFYPSEESPYLAYYKDMTKVIDHDLYRYQDYKKTFQLTHHICLFRKNCLEKLDNQLFNRDLTVPYFINSKPLDVDYQEDLDEWTSKKS